MVVRYPADFGSVGNVLTIVDGVNKYYEQGTSISFEVDQVRNPLTTKPSSPTHVLTRLATGEIIDKTEVGYIFTATSGTISIDSIEPETDVINKETQYTFTFAGSTPIVAGGTIKVTAPS